MKATIREPMRIGATLSVLLAVFLGIGVGCASQAGVPYWYPDPGMGTQSGQGPYPGFPGSAASASAGVFHLLAGERVPIHASRGRIEYPAFSSDREFVLAVGTAEYRISDSRPVFLASMAPSTFTFKLARFKANKEERLIKVGFGGVRLFERGPRAPVVYERDLIEVDVELQSSGLYKVSPKTALRPGEYAFVLVSDRRDSRGTIEGIVFDFGID